MNDLGLIIGAAADEVATKVAGIIKLLPANEVIELDAEVRAEIVPLLPPSLQRRDAVFGLKLELKHALSMAHSGWLYAQYSNACSELKIDPSSSVAYYSNGHFRQFGQFSVKESTALFLGFEKKGAKMLEAILKAEVQFNPDDFDTDGYLK